MKQALRLVCTKTALPSSPLLMLHTTRPYSLHRGLSQQTSLLQTIKRYISNQNNININNKELINNLKKYCSTLVSDAETESKLNEKEWNFLIQQICRDSDHDETSLNSTKEAIYWFNRIMKEKKLARPNVFTLNVIIKSFANVGDVETCEEILKELENQGKSNVYSYISYIKACIGSGQSEKGFKVLERMKRYHIEPNFGIYIPLLKDATNCNNRKNGLELCEMIKKSNLKSPQLSSSIAAFGLKVNLPQLAIEEFENFSKSGEMNVITFTRLIQAYIQMNEIKKAIDVIDRMKETGINPNATTFTILMSACSKPELFENGKLIHEMAKKTLNHSFTIELSTTIINFYNKCGHPEVAIKECEQLKKKQSMTVVTWNCLIQSYIQMNDITKAISLLDEMENSRIELESSTFVIILGACAEKSFYNHGITVLKYAESVVKNFTIELSNSVINFYNKCGYPEIAIQECENLKQRGLMNVVTWTCLIQSYIQMNEIEQAISVIEEMKETGAEPNPTLFSILISACTNHKMYNEGIKVHEFAKSIVKSFTIELSNSVINFYNKCGYPEIAIQECENLKQRGLMNVVTWTCLIQSYIQMNDIEKAISIIEEMKGKGFEPNSATLTILMSACSNFGIFNAGVKVHGIVRSTPKYFTSELSNTIINFYNKFGYPEIAIQECERLKQRGLMNVVTWTCLIQSYIQMNEVEQAISVIEEMKETGVNPNATTFTILMSACSKPDLFENGKLIHEMAKKTLNHSFTIELSTTIINFYNKCGHPEIAIKECEQLKKKQSMDVVAWTCLIQAYIQTAENTSTKGEEHGLSMAFRIYEEMKQANVKPSNITYHILLSACGEYVAPNIGMKLIKDIKVAGLDGNEEVISAMGYFYSRIGQEESAQKLFDNLVHKKEKEKTQLSIITYGNILSCYAQHGKGNEAKQLFNEMVEKNVELNEIIFIILLNTYSHCGMVNEAIQLYNDMKPKHNVNSTIAIDCVMVDVYSRAGRFEEAETMIGNRSDINLWSALMGGCRKFNNIEIGEKVFSKTTSIDEKIATPYILLSNIYSYHGLNEKSNTIRELMEKRGIKKIPGIVEYEEQGQVFKFISGSENFDRKQQVEEKLDEIYHKILKAGFKPDTKWVTNTKPMSVEEKVQSLSRHAEKLAMAHAFVMNPNRKEILLRILTKNLRICNDCHNATAYISKVMNVDIIVRDASRYHHFKDGKCSCGDYW